MIQTPTFVRDHIGGNLQRRLTALWDVLRHWDPSLAEHSRQTAEIAIKLARAYRDDAPVECFLQWTARLHDIGKIVVPKNVLNKPGALTDEEGRVIRKHPTYSFVILRRLEIPADYLHAVLFHHERWDGRGYPTGLEGEDIPLAARILAVADCYSALTSDRPYRQHYSAKEALTLMQENSGVAFDPKIVVVLSQVVKGNHATKIP